MKYGLLALSFLGMIFQLGIAIILMIFACFVWAICRILCVFRFHSWSEVRGSKLQYDVLHPHRSVLTYHRRWCNVCGKEETLV